MKRVLSLLLCAALIVTCFAGCKNNDKEKFVIPSDLLTEEGYRATLTEEDLFNEFTRDEKGNVVLSQEDAEKKFKEFVSGLDKAVKKGIITKNTANRKKSRAQLKLNKMAQAEAK